MLDIIFVTKNQFKIPVDIWVAYLTNVEVPIGTYSLWVGISRAG